MPGAIVRADLLGNGAAILATRRTRAIAVRPSNRPVTHQFAAVIFCTRGRASVEQRGSWTVEAGQFFLVPSAQPHCCVQSADFQSYELGFCVSCFAAGDTGALLEPFERVRSGASPVISIGPDRAAFLSTLFDELISLGAEPSAPPALVQRSLLNLILTDVQRAARRNVAAPDARGVVAEALTYIERNCLKRLSLNDVARAVGRTPAYVTSALSRATGRSALEWILAGRMAEARRMLLQSDVSVSDIGERIGYADSTHFIRVFRREHGATPAAWRGANRP